jgi:hypothetical protein
MTALELEQSVRGFLEIDLLDAASARFADWQIYDLSNGERATCVLINGKNRQGGYAGFQRTLIYSDKAGGSLVIMPPAAEAECELMGEGLSSRPD